LGANHALSQQCLTSMKEKADGGGKKLLKRSVDFIQRNPPSEYKKEVRNK